MFSIFKQTKTQLRSDEFETLLKRLIDLEQRIRRLELNEDDFRNKVLRKLQDRSATTETNIKEQLPMQKQYSSGKRRLGGKSAQLLRG